MFISELLVALAAGLLIVGVVSLAFGTKGPWDSFLWFFIVVSMFAWACGVWLVPFGPVWHGIGWAPIIFMGLVAALLLTAASPRTYRRRQQPAKDTASSASVDAFVWVLIICLVFFAVSRYMWYPRVSY